MGAWIFYYAQLVRFMGRRETDREQAILDAALARQLAAQPIPVACSDGVTRAVYPKSYHALRFLDTLNRELVLVQDAAARADITEQAGGHVALVAPLVESLAVRLWMWTVTSEGAGLPFDDAGETPEVPAWTQSLSASDLLALMRAHVQVNHKDLQIIAAAFPQDGDGSASKLSLAGFLGTAADGLGVRPFEVMRRWTLGELFAQRVTAAESARAAHEAAERKRKAA